MAGKTRCWWSSWQLRSHSLPCTSALAIPPMCCQGMVRSLLSLVVTHKPWAGVAVTNAPVAGLAERLSALMSWPNSFLENWMRRISTAIPDAQSIPCCSLSDCKLVNIKVCFLFCDQLRDSMNISTTVIMFRDKNKKELDLPLHSSTVLRIFW